VKYQNVSSTVTRLHLMHRNTNDNNARPYTVNAISTGSVEVKDGAQTVIIPADIAQLVAQAITEAAELAAQLNTAAKEANK
jgi:hypothetical protein